jgi:hypothetical protein
MDFVVNIETNQENETTQNDEILNQLNTET